MKKAILAFLWLLCLAACTDESDLLGPDCEPRLLAMSFQAEDNPLQLTGDIHCDIDHQEGCIHGRIPYLTANLHLVPSLTFQGDGVTINGVPAEASRQAFDFSGPITLTVSSQGQTKAYTFHLQAFTGLPVLWIETEDRQAITSREDFLHATLSVTRGTIPSLSGTANEPFDISIRGRGNSTWGYFEKKPYLFKFPNGQEVLDMPAAKKWVLLANHSDKTLLRNEVALFMGQEYSRLEWTPHSQFTELMLNGEYTGTYQLTEKVTISPNRLNIGKEGFLLEIDSKANADEVTFRVAHLNSPVNIKEPDAVEGDANYNYIKEILTQADATLYADHFTDAQEGWRKWFDEPALIDWYLINEIAANRDAVLNTSCYLHYAPGGKITMGPIWDFDIGFGNNFYDDSRMPTGLYVRTATWFTRLFQDSRFAAAVKERYAHFYAHKDDILRHIDTSAQYLRYAAEENDHRWDILYNKVWPNYHVWGSYSNEVQFLKTWLAERMDWLNEHI